LATAECPARPDLEATLLRWSNALLEATVLYLLLAAWARPREGPAALLPLAAALALPGGMSTARLVGGSTVVGTIRPFTLVLVGLAWAFAAARLSAPAAYWLSGTQHDLLVLGVVIGGGGSGAQPLAFWASLLLWWRGVMLSDWQPNLDDTLMRLALAVAVGAAAVGLSVAPDANGVPLVQLEQALGSALLLGLALLTTALGRRQEMAGWIKSAKAERSTTAPHASVPLVMVTIGLGVLAVMALVGLGASLLSRDALAPALTLGWAGVSTFLGGVIGLIRDLSSLLPHLPDPSTGWTPPPPVDRAGEESALNPPAWIGLLGLVVIALGLMALLVLPVLTDRQRRVNLLIAGLQAPSGGSSTPLWPAAGKGPNVVLALVLRLFRGVLGSPGKRRRPRHSAPAGRWAGPPEPPSIRTCYRDYLRWAACRGCTRLPGETPDELLERLTRQFPAAAADSALLTTLYVDYRYGGRSVSAFNLQRVQVALGRLRLHKLPDPTAQPVRSKLAHHS
jgi:Domain of unknown function (DUF4129)